MVTGYYLLGADLRRDVTGDDLGNSDSEVDRQVSLGIFDGVINQLGVFQHDGAIGNEGWIDCVLWLDLSDCVKVTGNVDSILCIIAIVWMDGEAIRRCF